MSRVDFDVHQAVVDASIVVRWIMPEQGASEALAVLGRPILWLAPRLMLTEVASALRRKIAGGEVSSEQASAGLDFVLDMVDNGDLRLHPDEALTKAALALAVALNHKVPDCLYLAVAERVRAGLVTADRKLGRLARDRSVPTLTLSSI